MAKPDCIELSTGEKLPILYEDRSVLAIDKPAGWMLVPFSWQKTNRNLQAAITSSIAAGDFWARCRSLRFLRFVHRLDAETTGILLLAKSPGALKTYSGLFEERHMEKRYLAVVSGVPKQNEWTCRLKLAPDADEHGKMRVDQRHGKEAETSFKVLATQERTALLEARPRTGRTHQIRVHLAESGCPVMGDELYGKGSARTPPLGLRAIALAYSDPFSRKRVSIHAPTEAFLNQFGFSGFWQERDEGKKRWQMADGKVKFFPRQRADPPGCG